MTNFKGSESFTDSKQPDVLIQWKAYQIILDIQ